MAGALFVRHEDRLYVEVGMYTGRKAKVEVGSMKKDVLSMYQIL